MTTQFAAVVATLRRSFADRFFPQRIASADALAVFVGQRAAYVAQTSLYGYLKTRMGTKFPQYFEDEAFAASIKAAAVRVFVSCAADLTVFAVALAGRDGALGGAQSVALARHCYGGALATGLDGDDRALVPPDAAEAFAARAGRTLWAAALQGDAVFAGSAGDVIRWAPVTDEFKRLDAPIVRNSIRFRWVDVREQLRRRLDAGSVCADWLARGGS